jgi:hypothetical protein
LFNDLTKFLNKLFDRKANRQFPSVSRWGFAHWIGRLGQVPYDQLPRDTQGSFSRHQARIVTEARRTWREEKTWLRLDCSHMLSR